MPRGIERSRCLNYAAKLARPLYPALLQPNPWYRCSYSTHNSAVLVDSFKEFLFPECA